MDDSYETDSDVEDKQDNISSELNDYSKEDLIFIIKQLSRRINLSAYQEELKLDRFKRTEFYRPSVKLTRMIDKGIEPVLDDKLFYMGEYVDLTPFVNSQKFFDILEFVLNRGWSKSKLDYIGCIYEALRHKNYKVVEKLYLDYVSKKDFIDIFILNHIDTDNIEIIKNIPSIKVDLLYIVSRDCLSCDFIFAYYKVRPEEFDVSLMHGILQKYYALYKVEIKQRLKTLFCKLINPTENYCQICYDKKCDCSKVSPVRLGSGYSFPQDKKCQICLDYFDSYNNCIC